MTRSILFLCMLCFWSCNNTTSKRQKKATFHSVSLNETLSYQFSSPQILPLHQQLKEISGLSFANNSLYTHNDEKGILYELNPRNGKILTTQKFGKDADYEGVEVLNDNAYIISSKGNLLIFNLKNQETKHIKTPFSHRNNVEGLCFNTPNTNALLIACKGKTLHGKSSNTSKAIYLYDIEKQQLEKTPFVKITPHRLVSFFKNQYADSSLLKHQKKQLKYRLTAFAPSGIAVHPKTGQLFILSARGSLLLLLNDRKEIDNLIFLDEKLLPQPEGICFDNDNNLYISTEGKYNNAKIVKYTSLKNTKK